MFCHKYFSLVDFLKLAENIYCIVIEVLTKENIKFDFSEFIPFIPGEQGWQAFTQVEKKRGKTERKK